jgi:phospholipid/cholesterol/gamma-HCH transport system substrate-binding protein
MRADARTRSRVGIIVFAALVVFGGIVLTIGGKTGFFVSRTSYFARFPNSLGLVEGNQVRLAGVTVGAVRRIDVPRRPGEDLTIHFDIEKKSIGLLGDKYLEVSVGGPEKPDLEPDHEIMAYRGAELDKILAGSGDLVDNVVQITKSLKVILSRTERGEGFLGEITSPEKEGKELSRSLRQTIDSANALLVEIRQGKGLLGRLIRDEKLANGISKELEGSVTSLHRILTVIDEGTSGGDSLVSALFTDPEGKKRLNALLDSLKTTSDSLAAFSQDLANGQGAVPKLLKDGTVGRLIADPTVSDALNDVIVGIDRSKALRWLIRNRQRSGIQKRYEDERTKRGLDPKATPSDAELGAPAPAPTPR